MYASIASIRDRLRTECRQPLTAMLADLSPLPAMAEYDMIFKYIPYIIILRSPDKTLKGLTTICKTMCLVMEHYFETGISKDEAKLDMTMLKDCIQELHNNLAQKTETIEQRVDVNTKTKLKYFS